MSTPTFTNIGHAVNHFFTGTANMTSEELSDCIEWVEHHAQKGCIWIEYRRDRFNHECVKTVDGWNIPEEVKVNYVNELEDIQEPMGVKHRKFNSVVEADEFARSVRDNGGYANVFVNEKLIGTFVNLPE